LEVSPSLLLFEGDPTQLSPADIEGGLRRLCDRLAARMDVDLRAVRAVERWQGKSVTVRYIIYRTLGVDANAPLFPPEPT
jgi:hypothetical protein